MSLRMARLGRYWSFFDLLGRTATGKLFAPDHSLVLFLEAHLKQLLFVTVQVMVVAMTGISLVGCAPSASQLKKVMEENPDIVFSVIEKHPSEFLATVNKAATQARAGEEERMMAEETKKREEEYKNPKKPEIAANRGFEGAADAKVVIVEYSDFECPYCRRGAATMKQVLEAYPGKVKVVFKDNPIERIHPTAMIGSQYYEAAVLQDPKKSQEFKHAIFENQQSLAQEGEKFLKAQAKKMGFDMARMAKDITSDEVKKRIAADQAEAEKFEFSGTPGYLINGVSLRGAYPLEEFKKIIDQHLAAGG
jgi:protein-disulfide isomerase